MRKLLATLATIAGSISAAPAFASDCQGLPTHDQLLQALTAARGEDNGGLNFEMWGTVVDRSGVICAVVTTGKPGHSAWPGSRLISAAKANTANNYSNEALALSTANLWGATQPGGSLWGLQSMNPQIVNYAAEASEFGTLQDPLVGQRIGGTTLFGGGLALYNDKGEILGGVGVSGDFSSADHNIAWRTRHNLNLDFVPGGVSAAGDDQITYDVDAAGKSASGFGHPEAGKAKAILPNLPPVRKVSKS